MFFLYLTIRKKTVLLVFACLLAIGLIPTGVAKLSAEPESLSASATDWGLSFQKEGEAPIANASRESLQQYNAYYMGDAAEKKLYLTFDAGYENGYTAQILDVLQKEKVPAAFFLVGNFLETAPDLVKRMVEEGHIVGNHTYSHPDMSKIADARAFEAEIERFEQGFRTLTGQELPRFYRPPQGKFSEDNLKQAKEMGYATVFWSLAYVDWYNDKQPTRAEALRKLTARIHPGAIVLLHSTSRTNAEVLAELLSKWKEMGYTFASLNELTNGK